ncbi:hypothetical protein [Shinella sp. JR1-6]|uniref:hypothetical protein n=1 Tax=Shinella sp. JR1-6 TaxID=2527671 RepID=UPI00102D4417|nr:hypothetical protein [Shinella sp. JR1-6]TAA54810.1 hypothetical protein EXZ48_25920 [Shinella sp. JR1-6]
MARIRHTGPVGSILTARKGKVGKFGDPYTFANPASKVTTFPISRYASTTYNGTIFSSPAISHDGLKLLWPTTMYGGSSNPGRIYQLNLAAPFTAPGFSFGSPVAFTGEMNMRGMAVNVAGTKAYAYGKGTSKFFQINMDVPFDLADIDGPFVSGTLSSSYAYTSLLVSEDGKYLHGFDGGVIERFTFGSPWDVTTIGSKTLISLNTWWKNAGWGVMTGQFANDGKTFLLVAVISSAVRFDQFTLATPYDILGSKEYEGSLTIPTPSSYSSIFKGVSLSPNGKWLLAGIDDNYDDGFAILDVLPWWTPLA